MIAPRRFAAVPGLAAAFGRAFASYLVGAEAFYAARFDEAEAAFARAKGSTDPWLADVTAYMTARTDVNRLQTGAFDDYGTLKEGFTTDPAAASRAEASLDAYVTDHPDGRYVRSARGLLRRVDWLAGRTEKLAGHYSALLAQPAAARSLDDLSLVEEIDTKLLPKLTPAMTRDPLLLAVMDLKALRRAEAVPGAKPGTPPARLDLDGQRDAFARMPALHEFLVASAGFAVDGAPAPVLKALPDDTRRRDGDYLWFSRQLLRGQALEATGDHNAPGFWRELAPGATRPLTGSLVELALALHDEAHARLDEVFASDSIVTDPEMRRILLQKTTPGRPCCGRATPRRPRARLRCPRCSTRASPAASTPTSSPTSPPVPPDAGPAAGVFARGPSEGEIGCPPLAVTARTLAADPASLRGRLCLAEFVRLNGMDDDSLDSPPRQGELGGAPTGFPGRPYARATLYASIIADRAAPADDRAYALHRAVRCYQPAGHTECGGLDAPQGDAPGMVRGTEARLSGVSLSQVPEALVVRSAARAAAARTVAALAFALGPGPGPVASEVVDAGRYRAFWLWAGVRPQPALANAETVYLLEGEVEGGATVRLAARRAAVPWVAGVEVWLVVRAATLAGPPEVYAQVLQALRDWRAAGNRVVGLQVDFDAATRGLAGYAGFLRDLRARLPAGCRLGITGLLDWSANGNPAGLAALAGTVDEAVLQVDQGRRVIPGYAAHLARLDRVTVPFRIGLPQGGEWTAPEGLDRQPLFRGYVVFLRNG